jgi:hypothetical protein
MFKPGESGNTNGRPKGTKNASSEKIKQFYLELLDGNLDNIQTWLTQTASEDPARALDFLLKLSPFVIPKKQETDLTIENPLKIIIPPRED